MNAVRVRITPELLVEMLRLPSGAVLVEAELTADDRYLDLTIEHPDLPVVEEPPGVPVLASPHYRKSYTETEPKVEFLEWGIAK